MPVINPATNKLIVKHAGSGTQLDNLASTWFADLLAHMLTNSASHIFDIVVSNTAPATNRLWFDPAGSTSGTSEATQGQLKVFVGGVWVNCTPQHFANWLVNSAVTQPLISYTEAASPPTPNMIGHVWKNTNSIAVIGIPPGVMAIWNGASWVAISAAPGQGQVYTVITSNTNATPGGSYLVDTSGGQVTLTLPPSPAEDTRVYIADGYSFCFMSMVIARHASQPNVLIQGFNENLEVNIPIASFALLYKSALGWRII